MSTTPIHSRTMLCCLAAAFSRSNMGHDFPRPEKIKRYLSSDTRSPTVGSAVDYFCGDLMETNMHYRMFVSEGRNWETRLADMTPDEIMAIWPDTQAVFWPETLQAPSKEPA